MKPRRLKDRKQRNMAKLRSMVKSERRNRVKSEPISKMSKTLGYSNKKWSRKIRKEKDNTMEYMERVLVPKYNRMNMSHILKVSKYFTLY